MEQVHLKYGTSAVDFEVDGAKSVKYLYENKMRVIEDIKAEISALCDGWCDWHEAVKGVDCTDRSGYDRDQ